MIKQCNSHHFSPDYYCLIISILLLPFQAATAQWEISESYNYKSEIPSNGIGIYAGRNLPFQWATIGLKVRAGADIYRETDKNSKRFTNEEYHVDLIATLFYRYISPYFGLSLGAGHYSVSALNKYIFLVEIPAGIKFPVTDSIQPFIELSSVKYFSSFDIKHTEQDISSFQFTGKAGFIIRF